MRFVEWQLLGPLPPLVVNTPYSKMGFGLVYWVVTFSTFSLFGVMEMLDWQLYGSTLGAGWYEVPPLLQYFKMGFCRVKCGFW